MDRLPFDHATFEKAVSEVCAVDTAAANGKGWTPENPIWGHCAVVALWMQNFYGGTLLRASLEGTPFAEYRSHYYNRTDATGGIREDLTGDQFQGKLWPGDLPFTVKDRAYVIGGADTRDRYARFGVRLLKRLLPDHPLMRDDLYCSCLHQALLSPCQKKGVGAALMRGGVRMMVDHNDTIEGLKDLCQPECIRMKIRSRTESMLGACGHAEERLLWRAARQEGRDIGYLDGLDLYVAAVDARGLPEDRPYPEFTCLRCAVAIDYTGIRSVNVVHQGAWVRQTPEEALTSAQKYALGSRKI